MTVEPLRALAFRLARFARSGLRVAFVAVPCLLTAIGPAVAQSDPFVTVRDVEVSAEAANAARARERAFDRAASAAWEKFVAGLPADQRNSVPRLGPDQLSAMVRGISVDDEKTTATTYSARFVVRFDRSAVGEIVRLDGGTASARTDQTLLVLPVYTQNGQPELWGDPNPWRDVWARERHAGSAVPLYVPIGDVADVADITAVQALGRDSAALARIARRNQADEVLVAHASLIRDVTAAQPSLQVRATRYGPQGEGVVFDQTYSGATPSQLEGILRQAARDVVASLDAAWQPQGTGAGAIADGTTPAVQADNRIAVSVPLTGLDTWLEVRRRLGAVPVVADARVIELSRNEARIDIGFVGSIPELGDALARAGLSLSKDGARTVLALSGTR